MVSDDVSVDLRISCQSCAGTVIAYHNHHPTEEEEDHLDRSYHSTCSNFFHPSLALDLNLVAETPYLVPPDALEDPFLDQTPDRTLLEEVAGNDAFQVH
jgi:hypothetical protein